MGQRACKPPLKILWFCLEREAKSRQRAQGVGRHTGHHPGFCCSVPKMCPTLCDPMDCSMPGFPVYHYLLDFAQTHVHWVGDAIQPSYPLSSPSPPSFNPSQHQGLFHWVSSSHQVAKVLELQLQHQSFQWIFRVDSFRIYWFDWLSISPLIDKGLSRVFSSTTVGEHQFFGSRPSLWSNFHILMWLLKNHSFD